MKANFDGRAASVKGKTNLAGKVASAQRLEESATLTCAFRVMPGQ